MVKKNQVSITLTADTLSLDLLLRQTPDQALGGSSRNRSWFCFCFLCLAVLGLCGGIWAFLAVELGLPGPKSCELLVPRPGIKPTSPTLESRFFTTGPRERSQEIDLVITIVCRCVAPINMKSNILDICSAS